MKPKHTNLRKDPENITPGEAVALAICEERRAAAHYEALAKKITNELGKSKFEELASDEKAHEKVLLDKYKNYTGGEFKEDIHEKVKAKPYSENISDKEALEIAIQVEDEVLDFYRKLARSATNEKSRKVLEGLAEDETRHIQMLEKELKLIQMSPYWHSSEGAPEEMG